MRTSILSPGSMCQSVIFGSLTLRNTNYVILGGNLIFQKFELSLSCSTFSRKMKISEIEDQNNQFTIAGKYLKKAAGNYYSQFPDTKQTRVEPSYPEIGEGVITKEEYIHSSGTRVNPQWKGGQLGYPNGPIPKLISQVKTQFLCWNSLITNFLS